MASLPSLAPLEFAIPSLDSVDGKGEGWQRLLRGRNPRVAVLPPSRRPKHSMVYSWELSHHDNTDSFNKRPLPGAECAPRAPTTLFKRTIYLGGLRCQDSCLFSLFIRRRPKGGSLFFSYTNPVSPLVTAPCSRAQNALTRITFARFERSQRGKYFLSRVLSPRFHVCLFLFIFLSYFASSCAAIESFAFRTMRSDWIDHMVDAIKL